MVSKRITSSHVSFLFSLTNKYSDVGFVSIHRWIIYESLYIMKKQDSERDVNLLNFVNSIVNKDRTMCCLNYRCRV